MIPLILLAHSVSISPSPNLHSFTRRSFALGNSPPTLGFVNRNSRIHFNLLRFSPTPNPDFKLVEAVRFDGPILDIGKMETADNCELVIETCITRTLPQALTLERGLESIKEALEELKFNHSAPSSGVWRFQVAVPPSPKALKWFCCQPESSGVFPQFFLSKETENPSCKSLHLNGTRGVFGIGAAIYFMQSSSHTSQGQILSSRYVSSDSFDIATYGFMDVKFDTASSSIKHEAGSFYLVIPEIELDEHEDVSILSATLAWDDAFFRSFEQAIQSLESSIYQTSQHCWPSGEGCSKDCIRAALNKVNLVEDKNLKMVSSNALLLHRRDCEEDDLLELRSFCQFYFRHSPNISASNNMMDHAGETRYSLLDCTNMNAVWATLIVEECSRLGLTYFCIAPGSRSSPLAIAASTHPLTTCIACFDERSLAFHAVGYARGSHKPAVVITSSGTAVSNLLPAVVEASQDFVPLLLLTADRPPELQSAGANQSINQVNHFGSFVRFFFSLPTPTDNIPARMVLTTLDSAIHWSICSPYGPVHINCPFREPLDDSPRKWMSNCLKGLDIWMSSAEPFTKYIQMPNSLARDGDYCFPMSQIFEIIQGAERGLLLLGAIHTEDEIWAALLLAKDLNWPVVADILSGLRLRKLISCFPDVEQKIFFVDHLDHALLSDLVRGWVRFNVVIQIGSRITSRRISQMLEDCYPCSYILVDNHPCRHDPSHFVTHRVHCSILQFVDSLLKAQLPCKSSNWCYHLRALDWMVGQEISFQIFAENSLTEPHVARVISAALSAESALFIGNSMAIRDADMYGCSYKNRSNSISEMLLNSELQCLGIRVAGNRGASGIDGLLSTAIGFAVGCNKRVFCVIGDVSFLHDTNGLSILNSRMSRQPMTIILINNQGGGIFSFLPIADRIDKKILHQYFYTSHNISIYQLCRAHSVRHLQVKTKVELQDALLTTQLEKTDCVIEVQSCISVNSTFHSTLGQFACQAAEHGLNILSRPSVSFSSADQFFLCKIFKMEYSLYRIQLCAPPTSALVDQGHNVVHKEGYILSLYLEDGSIGYGEVAPIEIHKESFLDVEEQLRFLVHVIKGTKISFSLPLLKGGFSFWIWNNLGIPENSIFPSVRLGLEMAILNAIAEREDSGLLNIIQQQREKEEIYEKSTVRICGLIDSIGTPAEVAYIASSLVEEGFSALKLKVARRINPTQDATVIQEVRRKVGRQIELRVDANRNWSYKDAIQFSSLVKNCDLQYIEEPVQDEDDIIKYCEESGLPVALDETVNKFCENPLDILVKYAHPGIVAVVIKPSVVGGFERAALIAKWAHQQGKMAVVSAAYESGLGLLAYIQFSYYLELQNADLCRVMNRKFQPAVAHGLGTYRWLKQDVTTQSLGVHQIPCSGFIGVSVADAIDLLRRFQINQNVIQRTFAEEQVFTYNLTVNSKDFSCSIKVHEMGRENNDNVVIFLHGFLGTGEDWISIMNAISGSARCISIDLPGHGGSKIQNYCSKEAKQETALSVEIVSDLLYKLTQDITPGKVTLVGYSMGARIALHMALMHVNKINGAVIISGSPGLKDEMARKIRQAEDVSRSHMLIAYGLQIFLDSWYAGDLWNSLRSHPCFKDIVASRLSHDDVFSLAKVLSDLSVGRQISLWEDLKQCKIPLLLVVGEKDRKFKAISQKMCSEIGQLRKDRSSAGTIIPEIVEVPSCGHAVHIENPLPVVSAVSQFLTSLRKYTTPEHSEEER